MTREMPWPHADGVMTLDTTEAEATVECNNCRELYEDRPTLRSARGVAHRHVAATGHAVLVTARRDYLYGPDARKKVEDAS